MATSSFDPTKYGATPVQRLGSFNPLQYGATAVQQPPQSSPKPSTNASEALFPSSPNDSALTSGLKTLGNVPGSALGFAKSTINFLNPINTINTAKQLGQDIYFAQQDGIKAMDVIKGLPQAAYDTLVPNFFKQLFSGDLEGAKKTITEDPIGQIAPVVLVLQGVAEKTGYGKQFDSVMKKTTDFTTKPITKTATGIGNLATNTLGITTGAGGEAVRTALKGGSDFTSAMRGKTSMQDVLQESQDAVSQLIQKRSTEYQSKLADIKTNTSSLDISPINQTLENNLKSFNVKPIQGEILPESFNRSTLQNDKPAQEIFKTVYDNMKSYGTQAGDRTPVALDTLKRSLSDLYSPNSSVRSFTSSMTDSVKTILKKNVPGYEEMTKQYSDYSNLLKDIKQNLAVGGKAGEQTAMNRLTGALKQNNELRLEVLKELEKTTGVNLKDKIAGAALSDAIPRGFLGKGIDIYALSSIFRGIISPSAFAQLLATSPRFVGELMNALGLGARGAWKILKPINEAPMIIYDKNKQSSLENILNKGGLSIKDVSRIDAPTKAEMIEVIDYARLKKPYNQTIEENAGLLANKFGIENKSLNGVANKFETLLKKTTNPKTRIGQGNKPKINKQ